MRVYLRVGLRVERRGDFAKEVALQQCETHALWLMQVLSHRTKMQAVHLAHFPVLVQYGVAKRYMRAFARATTHLRASSRRLKHII